MATLEIDASELAENITLEVHIAHLHEFRIRAWIVLQLIKLATWIAWFGIEVDE